jgi:hypothetical protein
LPTFVVSKQVCWLLSGDGRDRQTLSESTIGSPFQEVSNFVAALRFLSVQPAVEVVLAQLLERRPLVVDPGQQFAFAQRCARSAAGRCGDR